MSIQAGETYRFEQEVRFDGHLYGTDLAYSHGGQVEIRQGSDGFYWNGSTFVSGQTWNSTTVGAGGLFHYYDWTVPGSVVNGDTYGLRIRITNDPDSESAGNLIVRPAIEGGGGDTINPVFNVFD